MGEGEATNRYGFHFNISCEKLSKLFYIFSLLFLWYILNSSLHSKFRNVLVVKWYGCNFWYHLKTSETAFGRSADHQLESVHHHRTSDTKRAVTPLSSPLVNRLSVLSDGGGFGNAAASNEITKGRRVQFADFTASAFYHVHASPMVFRHQLRKRKMSSNSSSNADGDSSSSMSYSFDSDRRSEDTQKVHESYELLDDNERPTVMYGR